MQKIEGCSSFIGEWNSSCIYLGKITSTQYSDMLMKIDLRKAYDAVKWDFIEEMPIVFGFSWMFSLSWHVLSLQSSRLRWIEKNMITLKLEGVSGWSNFPFVICISHEVFLENEVYLRLLINNARTIDLWYSSKGKRKITFFWLTGYFIYIDLNYYKWRIIHHYNRSRNSSTSSSIIYV